MLPSLSFKCSVPFFTFLFLLKCKNKKFGSFVPNKTVFFLGGLSLLTNTSPTLPLTHPYCGDMCPYPIIVRVVIVNRIELGRFHLQQEWILTIKNKNRTLVPRHQACHWIGGWPPYPPGKKRAENYQRFVFVKNLHLEQIPSIVKQIILNDCNN